MTALEYSMRRFCLLFLMFIAPQAFPACELEVTAGDTIAFDQKELEVERSCETVKVTFKHTGKLAKNIMGHNWVLVAPGDEMGVGMDGMGAGPDNQYVKPNDARVLAATDIIGAGEETSVEFSLSELTGSEYTYICSFPGHWGAMRGTLRII